MSQPDMFDSTPTCDPKQSQWFTPKWLATKMVKWACIDSGGTRWVLEPSAGGGSIAEAIADLGLEPFCCELDERFIRRLDADGYCTWFGDFLNFGKPHPPQKFAAAVMNPPYENGQDVAHVLHALKFTDKVIALLRLSTLAGKDRYFGLWGRVKLNRICILSNRPDFGGEFTSMRDFAIFDLSPADTKRLDGPDSVRPEISWYLY